MPEDFLTGEVNAYNAVYVSDMKVNSASLTRLLTSVLPHFILLDFGSERFTFGFTIKDSPDHCINVSSWGSEEYINGLCGSFRMGDCGKSLFRGAMHVFSCFWSCVQ